MRVVIIGLIAFALLAAGGTALLVKRLLDAQTTAGVEVEVEPASTSNVFVLVADTDLAAGSTIARSNLHWQPWPEDSVGDNFISASTEDGELEKKFIGAVIRRGVVEGTPLSDAMVFRRDQPGFLLAHWIRECVESQFRLQLPAVPPDLFSQATTSI